MPAKVEPEGANRYCVTISGILRKSELEQVQTTVVQEMERVGKVRLLFILDQFKGWEKGADWGDTSFFDEHSHKVERIAIVGEERWRTDALTFALADMRKSPTQYFLPKDIDRAAVWLAAADKL